MISLRTSMFVAAAALALAACGGEGDAPENMATSVADAGEYSAADNSAAAAAPAAATAPEPAASQSAPAAAEAAGPGKFEAWTVDEVAGGANANCVIRIPAGKYRGVCKFTAEGGASFSVEHPNGYPLIGDVESFYLAADTRTDARLHGMDPVEGMQDYGIVTRPNTREACWGNATARICPYAK